MKVLQICNKAFYPERDGGSIAMFAMADGLSKAGAEVDVICLNIEKLYVNSGHIPDEIKNRFKLEYVDISVTPSYAGALMTILQGKNYQLSRFYSAEMEACIARRLAGEKYDVAILESLYASVYLPYIRKHSQARVVLRAHNIEADIWRLLSKYSTGFFRRMLYSVLSKRLSNYETVIAREVDAVFCLSESDARWFRSVNAKEVSVVPLSIVLPTEDMQPDEEQKPVFFHLASMEWLPHQQAIDWFIKEVWPLLNNGQGFRKIHLAGRKMPLSFYSYKNEVLEIEGEVNHPKEWMQGKSIMIVPSFSGGGVLVKSVEGLAMGKVIITTPNGAEGIPYENGVNMFVVNTAAEFVAVMKRLNEDPALCRQVSEAARLLAKREFDRNMIGLNTRNLLEKLSLE